VGKLVLISNQSNISFFFRYYADLEKQVCYSLPGGLPDFEVKNVVTQIVKKIISIIRFDLYFPILNTFSISIFIRKFNFFRTTKILVSLGVALQIFGRLRSRCSGQALGWSILEILI
jgi:hypothetical protein